VLDRTACDAGIGHSRDMYSINRILLAVKDPRARSQAALGKAAQLARALGAELQLFHAIAEPVFLDGAGFVAEVYADLERARREWYLQRLEMLARRARRRGIQVSTAATWDFPVCDSIIRQAARFAADLIMIECHPTAHRAAWLLRFTDWELLRLSPVPVLLVKNPRAYARPKVLAALDPTHGHSKPADLDVEIVRYASTLAGALSGPLHAVHAYEPPGNVKVPVVGSASRTRQTHAQRRARAQADRAGLAASAAWTARCALQDVVRSGGIPKSRQHVLAVAPAHAIEQTAHDVGADIVAMGTVCRSGLVHLFIGNTAEKVLDRLMCDVLVVKPRSFRNVIGRQSRGLQLVALPG
jgi:universal stress protein E